MRFKLLGLHHVTATVDDAQDDLDFVIGALGRRLVKKTVNFDNHGVYHFYYGDERGTPGSLWTTFPYKAKGVAIGIKGAGQVTTTSFSVPADSLDWWKKRLRERGYAVTDAAPRFGEQSLLVTDPSGLSLELVGAVRDARAPWISPEVGETTAVRGLHSVTLTVSDPAPTLEFVRDWFGFEQTDEMPGRQRLSVGGTGPGHQVDVVTSADGVAAKNGLGTVHHVAFAIGSAEEQLGAREALEAEGIKVTPVKDRCYFTSICFREPGGVLFEIATVAPGFSLDEPTAELGCALKLPPWEEPNRGEIERLLPPIVY